METEVTVPAYKLAEAEVTKAPLRARMQAQSGKVYKTVPVPLVGEVRIQNLSAREQLAVAARIPDDCENLVAMAHYVAACVLDDETDSLLYGENDIEEVLALDPRILATLSKEVRDLCGLDIGVKAAAKN